jgi:hypothetical protein
LFWIVGGIGVIFISLQTLSLIQWLIPYGEQPPARYRIKPPQSLDCSQLDLSENTSAEELWENPRSLPESFSLFSRELGESNQHITYSIQGKHQLLMPEDSFEWHNRVCVLIDRQIILTSDLVFDDYRIDFLHQIWPYYRIGMPDSPFQKKVKPIYASGTPHRMFVAIPIYQLEPGLHQAALVYKNVDRVEYTYQWAFEVTR